ncbi:MAG: ATP-binding protein [Acidimicrobiia bacterium]
MRPSLHLRYARGTTAHVSSLYPFSVRSAAAPAGAYVGLDVLSGGGEFCWDPFEAYAAGAVTNPNAWVFGEPGNGKSALVKCLLWRMAALYGTGERGRWFAIADPKGEYAGVARRLGLAVVRLAPGGTTRVNPLEPGPGDEAPEQATARRADMVVALVGTVLGRALSPLEDAAVFAVVESLGRRRAPATLADLAGALARPGEELASALRAGADDLAGALAPLAFAVDKLVSRSLRGMFDGRSSVAIGAEGPGIVVDLSAIPVDSEAMPLVMVAAAGWLGRLLAAPGPKRVQVIDEAWALLGNRHTAAYLQTCFKLGRTFGVANLCVAHRPSDLGAQADDGTATAKIATGLLADAATKIVLRQAPDQLARAGDGFGLTDPERQIVAQLARGRALWKVAGRTAVVQHVLSPAEAGDLTDTDAGMRPNQAA